MTMHFRRSALLILLAVGAVVSVTVTHQGRSDRKKVATSGRLRARLEVSHCGEHNGNVLLSAYRR